MELTWDRVGDRLYETGVDRGVLYLPNDRGEYDRGVAWNGLTTVTESPSGAEASPQYADNIKYLNLVSAEEFGATIEAFTFPEEFSECDGVVLATPGVAVGQQSRKPFGFAYRTLVGNDVDGQDHGYKIHLVYGALATPSEKAYGTVNDSPEAVPFSWELTTTPVAVTGMKPTALIVIDSTREDPESIRALEEILYGTEMVDPSLPLPDAVIALFSGDFRGDADAPRAPTFAGFPDNRITIPVVRGIEYTIGGVVRTGVVAILEDTLVEAQLASGFSWPEGVFDTSWVFEFEPS